MTSLDNSFPYKRNYKIVIPNIIVKYLVMIKKSSIILDVRLFRVE